MEFNEQTLAYLTPFIVQIVNELKHRNDLVTEEDVTSLLQKKLASARATGAQFLADKNNK
jgi:hypothetical protein